MVLFYYWPSHLSLKMFFIFLHPPKSLEYFWHFIFQEDMIDAMLGVSTCGLALLAALWLSPYTWWGTCDGQGKRVLFPWPCVEDAILSSSVPCWQTFCIPESLSAACPVSFASSSHAKGDAPMAAFAFRLSESVSLYFINLSLYRPKGFFLKQIWMFYSFLSSDQGIKHLGGFGLFFV